MDSFTIADKTFTSRLIVGTGKYSSPSVMVKANYFISHHDRCRTL